MKTTENPQHIQGLITKHGLAVMLVGLLAGFGWAFALLGELRISPIPIVFMDSFPGDPVRWRSIHMGCLLNGIMALAFAGVLNLFSFTAKKGKLIAYSVLTAIWGNTVFYICNLFSANRSLSLGDNALGEANIFGAIGFIVAMIAAIALITLVIVLIRTPLRSRGPSKGPDS